MRTSLVLIIVVAVGCGGDDNSSTIDGPPGADAPPGTIDSPPGTIDSPPGTIDAPPGGGPDATIGTTCGAATCTPDQECCVEAGGPACVDQGNCNGVTFACDGPEDCPEADEVCCVGNGGPGGGGAQCEAAMQCQSDVCHDASDCQGVNDMCCPIGTTGFSACLPQCPP